MDILKVATLSVANGDKEEFRNLCEYIPWGKIIDKTRNAIMLGFLKAARLKGHDDMVREILTVFAQIDEKYINEEVSITSDNENEKPVNMMAFIIHLLKTNILTISQEHKDIFRFIVDGLMEIDYISLVQNSLKIGPDPIIHNVLVMIDYAFPETDSNTIKVLYEWISDKSMTDNDYYGSYVYTFIVNKYEKLSDYAEKPIWIENFTGNLPTEEECLETAEEHENYNYELLRNMYQGLSVADVIDAQKKELEKLGVKEEEIKKFVDILNKKYENITEEEWQEELDRLIFIEYNERAAGDLNLFRLLGPSNRQDNLNLVYDTDTVNTQFGGCRMFISNLYDYNDENDVYEDWFRGACDVCHRRIRQSHHAVRRPKPSGGWDGCYCSWDHVRQDAAIQEGNENILLVQELIDVFENQINTHKIQDTIPS